MGTSTAILTKNNLIWLIVVAIVIACIIILALSRKDDNLDDETQKKNDRNLFKYLLVIAGIAAALAIAWYTGLFKKFGKSDKGESNPMMSEPLSPSEENRSPSRYSPSAPPRTPSRSPAKSPQKSNNGPRNSPPLDE